MQLLGKTDAATAIESLERDGFIIVKQALAGGPLDELAAGLRAMLAPHSEPGEDVLDACCRIGRENKDLLHRFHEYSSKSYFMNDMRAFVFDRIAPILPNKGFYLDIDSNAIFTLPEDERTTWSWHQESTYHPEMIDSVGFWFPIFAPATRRNGTMSVLAGSHVLGMLEYEKRKPTKDSPTSLIPVDIDRLVERFEEVHCVCDVGDAVLFHKDLIHRSNRNTDDKARVTGLVRVGTSPRIPDSLDLVY